VLRYLIFATVSVALMLSSIAATSLVVAFPTIMAAFSVPIIIAGWMISIYQLGLTATMPIVGKVSDVLGKKFTLMTCLVLFISGSMFCALSPNIGWLIFFRLIQAIGGGGFMPAAVGIVAEEFPQVQAESNRAFQQHIPNRADNRLNLGGWLVDSFGLEVGILGECAYRISGLNPCWPIASSRREKGGNIDIPGALLVGGCLALFMLSLTFMGYGNMAKLPWMMLFLASFWVCCYCAMRLRQSIPS